MSLNHSYSNVWYAWIPTNLGEISFNLFKKKNHSLLKDANVSYSTSDSDRWVKYSNIDLSFISDSLNANKDEVLALGDVEIKQVNRAYQGCADLYYKNIIKISCQFSISINGFACIDKIHYSTIDSALYNQLQGDEKLERLLASTVFNVIKVLVHSDGHHHQKIDTALKVFKNQFDCCEQMKRFAEHLKEQEFTLKHLSGSQFIKSTGMLHEAQGYLSYIQSFNEIFCQNDKKKEKESSFYLKAVERIYGSIKAKSEKRILMHDFEHKRNTISVTSTIFSLTIIFLFIRYAWPDSLKSQTDLAVIALGFILVILYFARKEFLRPYDSYKQFSLHYADYERSVVLNNSSALWNIKLFFQKIIINLLIIAFGIFLLYYFVFSDGIDIVYQYLLN